MSGAMRLCRFGDSRLGIVEGACLRDVTAALEVLPAYRYPLPDYDPLIANLPEVLPYFGGSSRIPLADVTLLSHVANPGKIIAAPVNYQKHLSEINADEQILHGNPAHAFTIHKAGLFLKATSSVVGPGQGIALRHLDRRNDHEIELGVVIGKRADRVSRRDALSYVAGYLIALDITIRGSEDRSFRKSPDSYTVLGPWLVTTDEIPDPGVLDLSISLNGELRQNSNTRHMILSVAELIELASSFYTLHPGDVISTGTPEGVSPIVPGDTIVATIEGIGSMEVAVRAA
jgi:2-keto-4-pentenoate hydratase/2-oxohepta-3-ene-1,7-dioic acid hydratase in catechol pathway